MKVRLTIDTVALHGVHVGQPEAFAGRFQQSIEEGLRSRLGLVGSVLPDGRHVGRERLSMPSAMGAETVGAGVAAHVLQPVRGSRR